MIYILLNNFYKDFAGSSAKYVIENEKIEQLYLFATGRSPQNLSRIDSEKAIFRAAYILEYIYFKQNSYFTPYKERFYVDFSNTNNSSAKRGRLDKRGTTYNFGTFNTYPISCNNNQTKRVAKIDLSPPN